MKFGFEIIFFAFRFWWRGGMRLWVSDFGGVSDEEREVEAGCDKEVVGEGRRRQ